MISQDEDKVVNSRIVIKGKQERQVENICHNITDIAVSLPDHVIAIGNISEQRSIYCTDIADSILLEALLALINLRGYFATIILLPEIAYMLRIAGQPGEISSI